MYVYIYIFDIVWFDWMILKARFRVSLAMSIYIFIYVSKYTYMYKYIHTYTYTYMYVCIYIFDIVWFDWMIFRARPRDLTG